MYLSGRIPCFLKALALSLLLLVGVKEGYGQRVYANNEQHSPIGLLSNVKDPERAIDGDLTNYSSLNALLGLLGALGTASQNLQFVGDRLIKYKEQSPIMIRFASSASILGLVNGISIRLTNGGLDAEVGQDYTGSFLLTLLNGSTESEVIIPIPASNQNYDGARLKISALIGLGLSAKLYYAFYIVSPELQSSVSFCNGEGGNITINNFQSGYTYKVYSAEIGGNEISSMETTTDKIIIPSNLDVGLHTYWIEARESNLYPSARTKLTVTVHPKPPPPNLNIITNSQY